MGKTEKSTKKLNLADWIVLGMQEKKAQDITVLDLRKIKSAVTDYFVICSAGSDVQADAIYNSIEETVFRNTGERPVRVEGIQQREWILMDYADVVVHVFKKEKRNFYALEDLWGDAVFTEIKEIA